MQIMETMAVAKETGALVMIHAENYDMIRFLTAKLEKQGDTAPYFHAKSRPIAVEREATHRAITLAELSEVPLVVVHVSNREAMEEIRRAQAKGLKIKAETCTQYLVLTEDDLKGSQHGGREIRLLASTARQGEPGRLLGRAADRRLHALLVGSLPVPLRRQAGQACAKGPDELPLVAERHPPAWRPACRSSSRRV